MPNIKIYIDQSLPESSVGSEGRSRSDPQNVV